MNLKKLWVSCAICLVVIMLFGSVMILLPGTVNAEGYENNKELNAPSTNETLLPENTQKEEIAPSEPPEENPGKNIPIIEKVEGVEIFPSEPAVESWHHPLTKQTWISSPFGMRLHPVFGYYRMHNGVDLTGWYGDKIVAARSGRVIKAAYQANGAGYYVTIDHGDGYITEYMHMTRYIVKVGDYVLAGELIGYMGSTGASTGPHLHFGMMYNGAYVDPEDYIDF